MVRALLRASTVAVLTAPLVVGNAFVGGVAARAQGVVDFTASITIDSFGTGASAGHASLCITGEVQGSAYAGCAYPGAKDQGLLSGDAEAAFTLFEDPTTCPATGTAEGDVTGVVATHFTWTRVGEIALISTTSGDLAGGNGFAHFLTDPTQGLPCGQTNVHALATGGIAVDPS